MTRVVTWMEMFKPYVGGIELATAALLPKLATRGFAFSVITSHLDLPLPDDDQLEGIPVRRFPFRQALQARDIPLIARLRKEARARIESFRPDLVHLNGVGSSAVFLEWILAELRLPLVITLHQSILSSSRADGSLVQRLLARADRVMTVSGHLAAEAAALAPAVAGRVEVVYHSLEDFPAAARPSFHPPRLLAFGRHVHAKGFDLLIRALPAIRGRFPDVRLTLGSDGQERAGLEALTHELGLDSVVDFTGWLEPDMVGALMDRASVVVVPSRKEGCPTALVQAALRGCPVVACAVGGIPEIIEHERTGLLCPPGDPDALARAVIRMLEQPEWAVEWGREAREWTRRRFNPESTVAGYETAFRLRTKPQNSQESQKADCHKNIIASG